MIKKIILAGGCFWCIEGSYRRISGVTKAISGYCGGTSTSPSYEAVSTGKTGHAESVYLEYNSDQAVLEEILDVFWLIHNPTTFDRQGADIGTQYRSAIFYFDDEDLPIITRSINAQQRNYKEEIVTEVVKTEIEKFYLADAGHQDFYNKNMDAVYCKAIIKPKIEKIEKIFGKRKSNILY